MSLVQPKSNRGPTRHLQTERSLLTACPQHLKPPALASSKLDTACADVPLLYCGCSVAAAANWDLNPASRSICGNAGIIGKYDCFHYYADEPVLIAIHAIVADSNPRIDQQFKQCTLTVTLACHATMLCLTRHLLITCRPFLFFSTYVGGCLNYNVQCSVFLPETDRGNSTHVPEDH